MTARIEPGGLRETGPLIWAFSRVAGRVMGTTPPHVFTTLGRGRGLFWGWLHFAGQLMPGGKLPRRETELVILRVATVRGSAYELSHHTRLGRRAGLTIDEIERVQLGTEAGGWSANDQVLLATTEQLLRDRDLDEAAWTTLRSAYDERTIVELLLLIGHYDMLATTLTTLRIEPDQRTRSGDA